MGDSAQPVSPQGGRISLWDRVRAFLAVLWACRISLGAVLIPLLLFWNSAAARDLFWYFSGPLTKGQIDPSIGDGEVKTVLFWSVFLGLTCLFWTYPVHFSARIILNFPDWLFGRRRQVSNAELETVRAVHRPFIIWLPRVLGTATFAMLSLAASLSIADLPDRGMYDKLRKDGPTQFGQIGEEMTFLLWALVCVFAVAAAASFVWFTWRPGHSESDDADLRAIGSEERPLRERYREAIGDQDKIKADVLQGKATLTLVTVVFLLVLFGPNLLGGTFFLALLLPVIFGAWVPALTLLAHWGHRTALPLTAIAAGVLLCLTYLSGDRHDISRADAKASMGGMVGPREGFQASVERWKLTNCTHDKCPRPIVLSTAGGASRAAFFTATVVGDLLDHPGDPRLSPRQVADRIFAISAVSGGSLGAVMVSAALANSRDGHQPCREDATEGWFRAGPPVNWRDCLQILTSQDYLSDTVLGLVFRDNFDFASRFLLWPDRAARLEQAWTDSFARHVRPPDGAPLLGLNEPFTRFGPATGSAAWQPLLVLNGTSVTTGRRILTSHIAPSGGRTFLDAYDIYEILSGKPACESGTCPATTPDIADVTLASAATNSARFPVISPAGTLRVTATGPVADRIVDGGYFENDGMTTTTDLVRALRGAGLSPAVLHIANDPLPYPRSQAQSEAPPDANGSKPAGVPHDPAWRTDSPVAPSAEDKSWFLLLRAPIGSLLATRTARSSYAITGMQDELPRADAFAEIQVYGELRERTADFVPDGSCVIPPEPPRDPVYKQVSMSWWVSQPVQQFLDTQLLLSRNCAALSRIRAWLAESVAPADERSSARHTAGQAAPLP